MLFFIDAILFSVLYINTKSKRRKDKILNRCFIFYVLVFIVGIINPPLMYTLLFIDIIFLIIGLV